MTCSQFIPLLEGARRNGPGWIARCPSHDDRNPSLSIREGDGGQVLLNCFAGCPAESIVRALGLQLADLFPASPVAPLPAMRRASHDTGDDAEKARKRAQWPPLESPVTGEDDTPARALSALTGLRHVSAPGTRLMATRGLLWFAAWKDRPAWVVTDGTRLNAQARRMDGHEWQGIGKSQTLPGSRGSWPVGAQESKPFPVVLVCEGGPDLLAAHHFIALHGREANTAAVALLGASNGIAPEALPHFAGKRIRILPHTDDAGRRAAARWKEQLESVGCIVDAADFTALLKADGTPAKDLNDLTQIDPKQTSELNDLIPNENTQI